MNKLGEALYEFLKDVPPDEVKSKIGADLSNDSQHRMGFTSWVFYLNGDTDIVVADVYADSERASTTFYVWDFNTHNELFTLVYSKDKHYAIDIKRNCISYTHAIYLARKIRAANAIAAVG